MTHYVVLSLGYDHGVLETHIISKITLGKKKEVIQGKTVTKWETELSNFNKKSLDINEFKSCCNQLK